MIISKVQPVEISCIQGVLRFYGVLAFFLTPILSWFECDLLRPQRRAWGGKKAAQLNTTR